MAYGAQIRAPRDTGRRRKTSTREKRRHEISKYEKRRREIPREKTRAIATGKKHRSRRIYLSEEKHTQTLKEIVDKTLNSLRILGNQRFALPPFYELLGIWLTNLGEVLSEFESSPAIEVDDQFMKDRSQILANVELQLEKRRFEEVSRDEATKNLSSNRISLKRIEEEYNARLKAVARRKDHEINRLYSNISSLGEELNRIARRKKGIFRVVSKKATGQKESEATRRLDAAEGDVTIVMRHFTAEQERLRDEYDTRKQPIIEQIRYLQKTISDQELDRSLEDRRDACDSLANAVNTLLQRRKQGTEEAEEG